MFNLKLENNISKIYLLRFFGMFLVIMPVIIPFFNSLGLGMRDIYLLQSIFAVTVFICEIPSGYVSDLLGRKKTLFVAHFLEALGFTLFAFAGDINLLIIAEIVIGVGISLSSGTDTALIYDTMEIVCPNKAQIKVLGKSLFYTSLGEGMASLVATLLLFMSFSLDKLALVSAALSWIPLFIILFIMEPPRKKMGMKHKENFLYIFRKLFRQSKLLNLILLNMVFYSATTLFAVWVFQKQWANLGIPLVYFGLLWALINFTVSFSSKNAHKLEKKWGSSKVLIFVGLLPIAGYFGISFIDHTVGFLACLLFQFCRGFGQVIFRDGLNKRVTGDFRATANSVAQMGTRVLFISFGPLFGHFIDTKGLSASTFGMGFVSSLVFLFVMVPLLAQKNNFSTIKKQS